MSKQNGSIPEAEALASANVAGGAVSIGKSSERREDGYVVTYTVSSSASEPVAVSFEDEFDVIDPDNVGFHRDHAPDSWEAASESVSVEHGLNPNETSRVKVGIVTGDRWVPKSAVMTHPEITNAEPIGEFAERSSGDETNGRGDPSLYEGAKRSLMAKRAEPNSERSDPSELGLDPADENDERADLSIGPATTGSGSPPDETPFGDGTATDRDEPVIEPLEIEPDELSDEPVDAFERSGGRDAERFEQTDSRLSDQRDPERPLRGEDSERPRESETASESICATLLEELEAGTVPEADLDALRAHLSAEPARSNQEPGRSDELRLSHVQSRLDELAVYVEMFEQFIDERGTFQEFANETEDAIDGIETELEALDDSIDVLRTDQEAANGDLEALRDRLDERETEFTGAVEDIERRQETTASELDRLEAELETELDEIRTTLDRFERLAEALESVFRTDEIDALEGV